MPRASDMNRCRADEVEWVPVPAAVARPRRDGVMPATPPTRGASAPPAPRRSPRVEHALRDREKRRQLLRRVKLSRRV